MLDAAAEEEGQPIRINPPYHSRDAERWPFGRHDLEPDGGSGLQACLGSDLGTKRADVHGTRQITHRARLDDHGPGNASSGVLPLVLLSWSVHGPLNSNSNTSLAGATKTDTYEGRPDHCTVLALTSVKRSTQGAAAHPSIGTTTHIALSLSGRASRRSGAIVRRFPDRMEIALAGAAGRGGDFTKRSENPASPPPSASHPACRTSTA